MLWKGSDVTCLRSRKALRCEPCDARTSNGHTSTCGHTQHTAHSDHSGTSTERNRERGAFIEADLWRG